MSGWSLQPHGRALVERPQMARRNANSAASGFPKAYHLATGPRVKNGTQSALNPGEVDVRSGVKSRPEILLPLYPSKRTQSGLRAMFVSCQQRKSNIQPNWDSQSHRL